MKTKKQILNITIMGLMTALLCIIAPLAIPIGPVPISLTMMVIYLTVYLFGGVKGTGCYIIYLVLGMLGVPVFSGFTGGVAKLAGPTGGYLLGFIFLAGICGIALSLGKGRLWVYIIGMVLGIIVAYAFGTIWFMLLMEKNLAFTLSVCVFPFLPFDAIKIAIIAIIAPLIKKSLHRISDLDGIIKY